MICDEKLNMVDFHVELREKNAMKSYDTEQYLIVHQAVENEDENALQTVENCKQVRHYYGLIVDVEHADNPSRSKENYQHCSSFDPCPNSQMNTRVSVS
jgi:hypothetical protein